ncbi:MAG: rRNA maturation RNase YbeY [Selenomonadaceae bacterium]|nr:rRNA maturation RNase YbeY [Selenomonadaceae bacterium]
MNVIISSEPDELAVEEILETEIIRAAKVIGELYGVENSELSITLTDDEHIHELNKNFRGIDKPTDVLSFAFRESDEPEILNPQVEILGDIIISLERAKIQAADFGHSYLREVIFLTVHGILHLLGYDHIEEEDRIEMEREQDYIMTTLGIGR